MQTKRNGGIQRGRSMRNRFAQSVILTLALAAVLAPAAYSRPLEGAIGGAAVGRAGAQAFVVTSTLEGKQVLPHRIRWTARPNLPVSQVSIVQFLIDGKLGWFERRTPYTYGDDTNWLVTSWLAPGDHTFVVRAKAKDGRVALQKTIARVLPAPAPPAELLGTWKHAFAGTWVLRIDQTGWKMRDPFGTGNFIDIAYLPGGTLQARGGIFTTPNNRFEGNGWCRDLNAPVNYRWAVSADTLTLTHYGPDRCTDAGENGKQHYVWNGDWTKSG